MAGTARRIMLKLPVRLTSSVRAKLSSRCGPFLPWIFSAGPMPAALTSTSSRPKRLMAVSTALCALSALLTSVVMNTAFASLASGLSAGGSRRSAMTTRAPACKAANAVAAPRPELPPVMRKTLFWIFMGMFSVLV